MVTQEFSEFVVDVYHKAMDIGLKINDYPKRMLGSCGAVGKGMIVVEPNGTIQNCWETVGHDEKKTGTLTDEGIKYTDAYIKWQGWTVFEKKNCINCNILPICMGGCPYKTIEKDNDSNRENYACVSWKYNLSSMLLMIKDAQDKQLLSVGARNTKIQKEILSDSSNNLKQTKP